MTADYNFVSSTLHSFKTSVRSHALNFTYRPQKVRFLPLCPDSHNSFELFAGFLWQFAPVTTSVGFKDCRFVLFCPFNFLWFPSVCIICYIFVLLFFIWCIATCTLGPTLIAFLLCFFQIETTATSWRSGYDGRCPLQPRYQPGRRLF